MDPGIKRKAKGGEHENEQDGKVLHLRKKLAALQEAQVALINYKKGGQPFTNLLTTIPIAWGSDQVNFIVGFLVDATR